MYIAVCGSCDMTLNGEHSCALFNDSVGRLEKCGGRMGRCDELGFWVKVRLSFIIKISLEVSFEFLFRFEHADLFSCILLCLDENLLNIRIFITKK